MRLYKLTDENDRTKGDTQWGPNVTHEAKGDPAQKLCSDGWIHAYEHPLIAVFMNPVHGNFSNPHLWLAEGEIGKRDGQLKCGCRSLTTIKRLRLPKISANARVRAAIYIALKVCKEPRFVEWAEAWLSGEDRSYRAADAVAYIVDTAAAIHAVYAADYAARAYIGARAGRISYITDDSAAYATYYAADAAKIDLLSILKKAIREERKYEHAQS